MTFLARVQAVFGAVARGLDRVVAALTALGLGAFLWPLAIGTGLGTGTLALFVPKYTKGIFKARATVDFMRPGLIAAAAGTAAVLTVCLLVALVRRRRGNALGVGELYLLQLRRFAALTALPLVVSLREPIEAVHATLVLGFALVTAVLVTYSLYHWLSDAPPTPEVKRRIPVVLLGLGMFAYFCATGYLSLANHLSFNTGRSDLGYYVSIFRQTSEGILLGCSLCGQGSHLTGHFDPIIIPLSPLYRLYPYAETILVLQTLWLMSGAVPVYLLAKRHTGRPYVGVALAFAYLAYPALHGVNLFDFHSLALCITIFLWLLYFLEIGKYRAYYVALGLVLLVREDMSIAMTFVAFSVLFSGKPEQKRIGWVTLLASAAYFLVAKGVFMGKIDPLNSGNGARGYSYFYEELIPAGRSTAALLGTLISDPAFSLAKILTEAKLDYVAKLAVPLLFLPLIAPGKIQLAYGTALTLLATRPFLHSVHFQYSSVLIPFLFGLTAVALGRVQRGVVAFRGVSGDRLASGLAAGILAATLLTSWKFGGLVPNTTFNGGFRPLMRKPTIQQIALNEWLKHVAKKFPRGTKLATNSHMLPHFGSVTHIYFLDDRQKADYVVLGTKQRAQVKPILADEAKGYLKEIDKNGDVRVFKTNYPKPAPGAASPPPTTPKGPSKPIDKQIDDD